MKTFRTIKFILLFSLLCNLLIYAQLTLRGTAPLAPGNYWKYLISSDGINADDSVSFFVKDSLVTINENKYFVIEAKDVSTITYVYYGFDADSFYIRYDEEAEDSIYRYMKYNCKYGDTWAQYWFHTNIFFSVTDTFNINAWGTIYKAKEIYLTNYSLIEIWQLWTDSLGLMAEVGEYYRADLSGCVINGRLYGDTTMYVTSVNEMNAPVEEFILYQNYPNPFNPLTKITYYIPYSTDVKLKVYNILAEEIATLVDNYQNAGNHTVIFNGNNFPSGAYIFRLEAGSNIVSNVMVLIK